LHVDFAVLDGLANEMIANIDMFGPRVEFVVLRERDSTLVVAVKGCWIFECEVSSPRIVRSQISSFATYSASVL